jgi:hypothetical protein
MLRNNRRLGPLDRTSAAADEPRTLLRSCRKPYLATTQVPTMTAQTTLEATEDA